jgi:transposase
MRKGFERLALLVQERLKRDPHCGHLFVFRGHSGCLIKVLWHDGQGMCLFARRLEHDRFWPKPLEGAGRSRRRSSAICSKASTGGIRSGCGGRKLLVERLYVTRLMHAGRSCDSISCDDHRRFAPR